MLLRTMSWSGMGRYKIAVYRAYMKGSSILFSTL